MPVTYVYTENSISEFRTLVNIIGANVGDLDRLDLPYPGNVDLVSAINALYELVVTTDSNVGDISLLLTNEKATTVGAINELWANAGPLPNLYTNEKGKAHMQFYTADDSTQYTIQLVGLTATGDIIFKKQNIQVQ